MSWNSGKYDAQQSESTMQRKPLSLASRTVVLTHTSVVTPQTSSVSMPRFRSINSRIRLIEGALARLVDHRLAGSRIKLRDDVVSRLTEDEYAARGARSTDAQCRISPFDFNLRRIREVGPVAFAGVDDENTGAPRGREHIRAWRDSGHETRNVVAKRGTEPARLQKIPLHVNDDEGGSAGVDGNRFRLCFYGPHWQGSLRLTGRVAVIG